MFTEQEEKERSEKQSPRNLLRGGIGLPPVSSKQTKTARLIRDLTGDWQVKTLGFAAPLNRLGDRKSIVGKEGHNILKGKSLGWFSVRRRAGGLLLDYNDERNPRIMRSVRDHIWQMSKDKWFGHLYWFGRLAFEFELLRVIKEEQGGKE